MSDKKSFSQADLDAAVEAAVAPLKQERDTLKQQQKQSEFSARASEAKTLVDGWVSEGKLLPAQVPGMVEFLSSLSKDSDAVFEFSESADSSQAVKKVTPFEFMNNLLGSLGKQIEFNRQSDAGEDLESSSSSDYAAPQGMTVDPDRAALDKKAMNYSKQHNVDYATAVQRVAQEDS